MLTLLILLALALPAGVMAVDWLNGYWLDHWQDNTLPTED